MVKLIVVAGSTSQKLAEFLLTEVLLRLLLFMTILLIMLTRFRIK